MSKYDDLRRLREARYSGLPQVVGRQQAPIPERQASPAPPLEERTPSGFDRKAYQREYMRGYMRKRRVAAKRPPGTP